MFVFVTSHRYQYEVFGNSTCRSKAHFNKSKISPWWFFLNLVNRLTFFLTRRWELKSQSASTHGNRARALSRSCFDRVMYCVVLYITLQYVVVNCWWPVEHLFGVSFVTRGSHEKQRQFRPCSVIWSRFPRRRVFARNENVYTRRHIPTYDHLTNVSRKPCKYYLFTRRAALLARHPMNRHIRRTFGRLLLLYYRNNFSVIRSGIEQYQVAVGIQCNRVKS